MKLVDYQQPTCLYVIHVRPAQLYGKWCFNLHVQCCGSCMVSTKFSM